MSLDKLLSGLLPELAAKARIHLARCDGKGIGVAVTSGWRTPTEQLALYAKGRARTPDGWVVLRPHEIVTFATPEHAPHCKGAAYDIVPIVDEMPAWHRLDLFQAVADLSLGLGLVWGGHWDRIKDLPHYELPGWRELPIKEH